MRRIRAFFRPILESTQGPVSLGFLLVLASCAAQDAQRLYTKAQKQMIEAQAQSPGDRRLVEAREALKQGEIALESAVYDQAYRSLRQSMRLTDEILSRSAANTSGGETAPAPAVESSKLSLPSVKSLSESPAPRALPRDALAKYLAGKRGAQKTTAAPSADAPAARKAEEPKQPPVAQDSPASAVAEAKVESDAGEGVVIAAAEPSDKVQVSAPAVKAQEKPAVVPPVAPPVAPVPPPAPVPISSRTQRKEAVKEAAGEKPMTKIPGALRFGSQEVSLDAETMMNLNQTSKYLSENPSTTLILRGHVGPGENAGLLDSRFESIRAYLIGKGVPEDQVRLDNRRLSGPRGEFEMFVMEH